MALGGRNLLTVQTGGAAAAATMKAGVLAAGQLASGDNTIYTCPSNGTTTIATLALTNNSVAPVAVVVQVVPSGGSIGATHVQASFTIPANDTITQDDVLRAVRNAFLSAGDVISVNAAAATAVNYLLTGSETT